MRLKCLSLFIFLLLFCQFLFAQQHVCGTHIGSFDKEKSLYPDFYESLEELNIELEQKHKQALSKINRVKSNGEKKIIPVVVHVIYDDEHGGNISNEAIQEALDILNDNFNGQASNFLSKTPDVFANVRGDLNVEFRLAKLDPKGNPTTGINRVFSSLTYEPEPRNAVKALSYWNSFEYFNIWTVRKFAPQSDGNTLLGFAQFPWSGSMSTDGVVLLSSQMESGGTLTHETGHWLGLRHTWGDADCGDDDIQDTPPAYGPNWGVDISDFPYHAGIQNFGCIVDTLNPAGEMFVNYMDYSDDEDVTMFTKDQVKKMNETLEGTEDEFGYREYLWSSENIDSTGVGDGIRPPICTQRADFTFSAGTSPNVCLGEMIYLKGNKNQFGNGNIDSYTWNFGNGETDNTGSNPIFYTYPEVGNYDVSLDIVYSEVTEARSSSLSDLDIDNATQIITEVRDLIVQSHLKQELIDMGAEISSIQPYQIDHEFGVYFSPSFHFWRGVLKDTIYIAQYTNTCTASVTKEGFIRISPTSANNTSSSYSYSFEDPTELDADWNVVSDAQNDMLTWGFNTNSNSTSWEHTFAASIDGDASIKIDGFEAGAGSHEIISQSYDLSDLSDPAIKFSWSAAAVNTNPLNELRVSYSVNCGEEINWPTLAILSPNEVANAGLYSTPFKPKGASEWNSLVLTKSQLKDNNVIFKFEYIVNDVSNNLYIDDIQIGEEAVLSKMLMNSATPTLSLFPNPAKEKTTISISDFQAKKVNVSLFNILGDNVINLYDGTISNNIHNITADFSSLHPGIYFIKLTSEDNINLTNKLILTR